MSTPISRRLLAAPVALLLAAGLLAACGGNGSTTGSTSAAPGSGSTTAADGAAPPSGGAPVPSGGAPVPSEGAPAPSASEDATDWPPSSTSTPLPEPTGSPTTDPALEETWSTAVRAIADDDSAAFLTVAAQSVYDRMTAEQKSVRTVFNDWDMMGARWSEFGVDNPRIEVTAGSCTQGAEPPSDGDSEGSPTVTCRLTFTNDAGGAPDKTMGLFYLQRNEDGSWTIVGYLRQYL